MAKTIIILAATFLLTVYFGYPGTSGAQTPAGLQVGDRAPDFEVESGDGMKMTGEMIRGKVAVIFYETKDVTRKNADMKDRLNELYDAQSRKVQQEIIRLPVFKCSRVIWPLTLAWKKALRKHSKRVGVTLYCDWDGRMFRNYRMPDNESNCLMIDKQGIVRFSVSGRITEQQFKRMEALLDRLVNKE
jgi:hypothetical protein